VTTDAAHPFDSSDSSDSVDFSDVRAADDWDIRNLLSRLAHLADDGDLPDYLEAFTVDAVWEMPANPVIGMAANVRTGHDDILAGAVERRASGLQGPGTSTRHVVHTTAVEFDADDADRATSVAYWQFYADTATSPRLVSMGRYDTVLRRDHARWRVQRRKITVG
jgi:3-phenylpropionate/cinnamic acid dioxygenase small subunit